MLGGLLFEVLFETPLEVGDALLHAHSQTHVTTDGGWAQAKCARTQ
jgi:hypothetical protein